MPNPLSFTWVKNVYSLRIPQGINSVFLSPISVETSLLGQWGVQNPLVLPSRIPSFTTIVSTVYFGVSYLLKRYLYPLSTEPINTKTQEN